MANLEKIKRVSRRQKKRVRRADYAAANAARIVVASRIKKPPGGGWRDNEKPGSMGRGQKKSLCSAFFLA
jgi:hypothetical protein